MSVPDALIDVLGRCPQDRAPLTFEGDTWACSLCGTVWDPDGTNGRTPASPVRPLITDRPTDSTSPSVLDQPQPE